MSYRIEIERETRPGLLNVYGSTVVDRSNSTSTAPFAQLAAANAWARRYAIALTSPSTCRVVDASGRTVGGYRGDGHKGATKIPAGGES